MTVKMFETKKSLDPGTVGVYTIYGPSDNIELVTKELAKQSMKSIQSEKEKFEHEKWFSIAIQVSVPFFIAGCGTIGAGLVMAYVTQYHVFKAIPALYILVPALLGLKGNLDMCLASRLSTQSNLGNMKCRREMIKMVAGNLLLVQIQSIVASCVVSIFAVSVSALLNNSFDWIHALLLTTASTLTATMSCFFLDLVLISIIMVARKLRLNPDNIATPMAASIGDVVSLMVLSTWARLLFRIHEQYPWLMGAILGTYIVLLLPIWIIIVRKNEYSKEVLANGWTPVITALFISGSGGLILDLAVRHFRGYTVFQPIINGIGGNLVSVQASRTSTILHKTSFRGMIPPHTKQFVSPWKALISGVLPARTARILLLISIPGHTVFVLLADLIYNSGQSTVKAPFILTYIVVGTVQLILLLYICHIMVHTLWRYKMDPDNNAIPYLTALGDLLGSTLLLGGFYFLKAIHQEYEPTG